MREGRATAQQKKIVAKMAKGCCEYCRGQARFAIQPFSIEHIIPVSQGGATILDNLALACQGCNNHKYNKTEAYDPASGELAPLYHPREQAWNDHFVWSEDYTLVLGITPTGRATVEALHLNRDGIVNLRRILYALGEHPPLESEE